MTNVIQFPTSVSAPVVAPARKPTKPTKGKHVFTPSFNFADLPVWQHSGKKGKSKGLSRNAAKETVSDASAIKHRISIHTSVLKEVETDIRADAINHFLSHGMGNYVATHEGNEVRIELKKYCAALSGEAIDVCKQYKLPVEVETSRPETVILNPSCSEEQKQQAMAILAKAGLGDVLMGQTEEARTVTTHDTIPAVLALPREVAVVVLPLVSTLAVGNYKWSGTDQEAADRVAKLGVV